MSGSDPALGVWLVDKPAGPTSHDIVAGIRRRMPKGVKVGHAGTLDPFATGLLVVVTGRATRLVPFLTGVDKSYVARIQLGARSVTGDPEGPITPTGAPTPTPETIVEAVAALVGPMSQRVPAYSAVKVAGEPLHRSARRGAEVERPVREIMVRSARVGAADPAGTWFDLHVTASKGTYIRQLASDLGETLGTGAYCSELRRTACGSLSVDDAVPPDEVPERGGVDPVCALEMLPHRVIDAAERDAVVHGRSIDGAGATGSVALVHGGALVAIADARDGARLAPKVVLA